MQWRLVVIGLMAWSSGWAAEVHEACRGPEYRAFDFLHGIWKVTDSEGRLWGHSQLEPVASGCGTLEHWYGARGGRGNGLVFYDAAQKKWQRVYAAAGFQELDFPGEVVEAGVRFFGSFVEKGVETRMRVTYRRGPGETVEITDESSADGVQWKLESTKVHTRVKSLPAPVAGPAIHPECKAAEFREMGRWLEAWKAGEGSEGLEEVRVSVAARGCVLIDTTRGAEGREYAGLTFYDAAKGVWHRRSVGAGKVLRQDLRK